MDTGKLKRQLVHCTATELHEIRAWISDRLVELGKRVWMARKAATWTVAKKWKPGDVLYCHAPGTFLDGHIQRGDRVEVYKTPRAQSVWFRLDRVPGKAFRFGLSDLTRYDFRPEETASKVDELDRKMAETVGKIMAGIA